MSKIAVVFWTGTGNTSTMATAVVEVLEESEFAPMFDECKPELPGKKVALFGSYGWGTGEWMENWEADCAASGIKLATDSVIANEMPDEEALAACKALGAALV